MEFKFDDATLATMFGTEDAESENPERLKEYFFKNKAYQSLKADLPIRVLVGYKGVGKSAILRVCHIEDEEDNILALWVRPNDVFGAVDSQAQSFLQLIENWKSGLTKLIVLKALEGCGIYGEETTPKRTFSGIRHAISSVYSVVNDNISRNNSEINRGIANSFLKNKKIRVYLDDLDRGWEGRKEDIKNISALLNAVRDLSGEYNSLQFRIGLRTDVYHLVRTSDESTDKIEANVVWLAWTNHEILATFAQRVGSYFGDSPSQEELVKLKQNELMLKLDRIIDTKFHGRGKWENIPTRRILMTLTRKRPRDLIKLFYYSAREADSQGANKISSSHLQAVFEKYSSERLTDIVNEFKTEVPNLKNVILAMRQTRREKQEGIGPVFDDGSLVAKVKSVVNSGQIFFSSGEPMTPIALARFLYRCDFLTARFETEAELVRKHFSDNQLLASPQAQFGFKWEIHPAYRWALTPEANSQNAVDVDLIS